MNLPTLSLPKIENSLAILRATTLAAPIGAIAVSLLIFLLVAWPKFSDVLRMRSENQQLTVRAQNLQQKAQRLAAFDKLELDLQLLSAEQILPFGKDTFSLIAQIERAASTSGVILSRLETTPGVVGEQLDNTAKDQETTPKIELKVALVSDYGSYLQFLERIRAIARIVAISDLTISSSRGSEQAAQLRTSMTLNAYWQPLTGLLSSIETPIEELTDQEVQMIARVQQVGTEASPVVPSVPAGKADLFAPF